jgi:hypothetical protein
MPELPSSGLFAPTVMIAERAAELVAASGGAQPSSQAQPLGGPR